MNKTSYTYKLCATQESAKSITRLNNELLLKHFGKKEKIEEIIMHRNVLAFSGLANGAAPSRCI